MKLNPDLCISGLYVSRNTYIRSGVAEWTVTNPVHVVCIRVFANILCTNEFKHLMHSKDLEAEASLLEELQIIWSTNLLGPQFM